EGRLALVKGATGVVLERCSHIGPDEATDERRNAVLQRAAEMGREGMRVLALAQRKLGNEPITEDIEQGLTLVGLAGMRDPLREEDRDAVQRAQSAGIRVGMVAGDQRETAGAVAQELGIAGRVVTGREVDAAGKEGLAEVLQDTGVFT